MAYLVRKNKRVKQKDGTVREVPGNYYICWRDREGKQRTKATGTDRFKDAERQLTDKKHELDHGVADYPGGNFAELWDSFLAERVKPPNLSEASWRNYKVAGSRYFCAKRSEGGAGWGSRRVEDLTPREIRRYFVELTDTDRPNHRTTRRANGLMSLLSGYYSWLWETEIVAENPVKKVKRLKNTQLDKRTISYEQAMLLLDHIDPRWYPHASTCYWAGVRIGELKGLTMGSFSTTRRQLKVDKTIYRSGTGMIERTGKPFGPTKSAAGVRTIPLPGVLYDILMDWKANGWHRETRNRWDLLYPGSSGGPLDEEAFREAIKEAGIAAAKDYYDWDDTFPGEKLDPKTLYERVNIAGIQKEHFRVDQLGPHLLRHGFARFALEHAGLSLVELQRIGGWSSYAQTLQYAEYQRPDADVDPRAGVLMDAAIASLAGTTAGTPGANRHR